MAKNTKRFSAVLARLKRKDETKNEGGEVVVVGSTLVLTLNIRGTKKQLKEEDWLQRVIDQEHDVDVTIEAPQAELPMFSGEEE